MSKRAKLQKEYYKEFGNYKADGKYSDHYVDWLESRVLLMTKFVSKSNVGTVVDYDLIELMRDMI